MSAKLDAKQFGAFGKRVLTGAQAVGEVFHAIRAHGGDATVNYTSASGDSIAGQVITQDNFEYDIFSDLEVTVGTVYAYLSNPV